MNQPVKPPQDDVAGPSARHKTTQVMVGNVAVGGGAPIVVQSMTNTDTADIEGTIAQVAALARAGSEMVRITVDRDEAAAAVPHIRDGLRKRGITTPLMPALADWMNRTCPLYAIDTPQEFCHFLAQACHETDHFKTLREYASGQAYEGRRDLGNTRPGDGVRFKGRGIFQTTGRSNYLQLGIKKGRRDLFINTPALLEQPEYAVWSACEYWQGRGLNDAANHADSDLLSRIPDVVPIEAEGAWHPADALFAPLTAAAGSRLGLFSVPSPVSKSSTTVT